MKDLYEYLTWAIVVVSILIATIVIYRFKKLAGFLIYFGIWAIVGAFLELFSSVLATQGISNLFVFHFNAVIEFGLLVFYFHALFTEIGLAGVKPVFWPGILLITANTIFVQTLSTFNSYSLTLISLGAVLISIFYFIRLSDSEMSLDNKMLRVILTGSIFLLHSSNLFPLLFGNYLVSMETSSQLVIWVVRSTVILLVKIIIFYTLLAHFFHVKV